MPLSLQESKSFSENTEFSKSFQELFSARKRTVKSRMGGLRTICYFNFGENSFSTAQDGNVGVLQSETPAEVELQ